MELCFCFCFLQSLPTGVESYGAKASVMPWRGSGCRQRDLEKQPSFSSTPVDEAEEGESRGASETQSLTASPDLKNSQHPLGELCGDPEWERQGILRGGKEGRKRGVLAWRSPQASGGEAGGRMLPLLLYIFLQRHFTWALPIAFSPFLK